MTRSASAALLGPSSGPSPRPLAALPPGRSIGAGRARRSAGPGLGLPQRLPPSSLPPPRRRRPTRVCGRWTPRGTLSAPASEPTQGLRLRPDSGSHTAAVAPGPKRRRPKGQCVPAPDAPTPGAPQIAGPARRPTPARPEPQSQSIGHGVVPTRGPEPRRLRVRPGRALSPRSARGSEMGKQCLQSAPASGEARQWPLLRPPAGPGAYRTRCWPWCWRRRGAAEAEEARAAAGAAVG